jgi:hypothetical protein
MVRFPFSEHHFTELIFWLFPIAVIGRTILSIDIHPDGTRFAIASTGLYFSEILVRLLLTLVLLFSF